MSIESRDLRDLQRKMKAMDAKALKRELNKALRDEGRPLIAQARDAARDGLPRRGGLAERIATRPMTISVTTGRVRIRVKGTDSRATDRGRLRHPVFGNDWWVTQSIRPGWFTNRMREKAPGVRVGLVSVVDKFSRRVEGA